MVSYCVKNTNTQTFPFFAPKGQRILAGGETAGKPVIIALAPYKGRGTSQRKKIFSFLRFASSTPPGCKMLGFAYRRFHRRLISIALSGQKAKCLKLRKFG